MMEEVLKISISQLLNAISKNENFKAIENEEKSYIQPYLSIIESELNSIQQLLDSSDKGASVAYECLTRLYNAQSGAKLLESTLMAALSTPVASKIISIIQNAVNWVKNHLLPWLQNIWSAIWGIIQKLLTPKEWKLKGELGTGVLGFASASIEITFS